MTASVAQQPRLLGQIAVQSAIGAGKGDKIESTHAVPVKVATKANASEFAS